MSNVIPISPYITLGHLEEHIDRMVAAELLRQPDVQHCRECGCFTCVRAIAECEARLLRLQGLLEAFRRHEAALKRADAQAQETRTVEQLQESLRERGL